MLKHPESKHVFSCYYHAAGLWKAIWHGHRDVGADSKTARGQVLLSLAGLHFAAFACLFSSAKQSPSLAWVHKTL